MRLSEKGRAIFDRNKGKPTLLSDHCDKDMLNSHGKFSRGTQRICSSLYLFPRGILLAGKNTGTGVPMSWLGNLLLIEVLPGNY